MTAQWLFLIVLTGYFLSWVLYFIHFELRSDPLFEWGKRTASVTLWLHLAFMLSMVLGNRPLPTVNLWEYGVPLFIAALSYILEWRYGVRFLMLFSLPIVLLISLLAFLHSDRQLHGTVLAGPGWSWLHIGFILAGLAGLVTAVSSAMMYLLQSSQLKSKHLGKAFLKLPSLDLLDRIHFRSLVWGVILFSLGILSGLFWARDLSELGKIFGDSKVILSFLTCLMYWVILSLRLSALGRGQKIALGTLLVFALLFVTLASSYYGPSALHKGF